MTGGTITGGQGTSKIIVDWGQSNPDAQVSLYISSKVGCENIKLELPVRINVELDTETPRGPIEVCNNKKEGISYSVTNTNGSVYTWELKGGVVKEGQGTNEVLIDWIGIGKHKIWVNEKSVTVDTICFGISDDLEVLVYKDSVQINIDYVSVSLEDERTINIKVNEPSLLNAKNDYALYKREPGRNNWELVTESSREELMLSDGNLETDVFSYEYMISSLNPCEEEIISPFHKTLLLSATADNDKDQVHLEWNAYVGWSKDVKNYEIYRKVDNETDYKKISETNQLQFTTENGKDGFNHHYRIKAIEDKGIFSSWSNEATVSFEHLIDIPNVFTPNGDNVNETFTISKLEMYPENELLIFNRWGKVVLWLFIHAGI